MNFLFIKKIGLLVLVILLLLSACSPSAKLTRNLDKKVTGSPVFSKIFTGFTLYDPVERKILFEHDADKYFTPASNTKIFTLYTSLSILPEEIPALKYLIKDDSLIFWGTGDPSFLYAGFSSNKIFNFLKNSDKKLFYFPYDFSESRYGSGWAWDDYPYYFQPEKAPFPIYGNLVNFTKADAGLLVEPAFFSKTISYNPKLKKDKTRIARLENKNIFQTNDIEPTSPFNKNIPFIYSKELFVKLLSDTLKREVDIYHDEFLPMVISHTVFSVPADSLYKKLMHDSDNFIAEQLLLQISDHLYDKQNTELAIKYAKDNLFNDSPDKLVWVDGSGLSRYNLFTPRTIVYVLEKFYNNISMTRIKDIFSAGGVSGTIKSYYGNDGEPYIYAKTGTLSNKHCLSGYIFTKSGKTLIFSFMHNNYVSGSTQVKKEMERVLRYIYETY